MKARSRLASRVKTFNSDNLIDSVRDVCDNNGYEDACSVYALAPYRWGGGMYVRMLAAAFGS